MTCHACEEARLATIAFYDRMAAAIRKRAPRFAPPKVDPARYHDKPFVTLRGPSNTREPYTQAEIEEIRKRNWEHRWDRD